MSGAGPRILVVKLGALGDVVMASAMLPAIHARWPDAQVTWVVDEALSPIVERLEGVDRVVTVPFGAILSGTPFARASALLRTWWGIGLGPWDLVILAHTDRRYAVIASLTWARRRLRFDPPRAVGLRRRWMGEEFADLVRAAEVVTPVSLPSVRALPPRGRQILLAPGGARNTLRDDALRRWPIAHWIEVARALNEAGYEVVLIGGRDDAEEARAVRTAVPEIRDLVGGESLLATFDRIAAARLLLVHDSGPLHLAVLARTPTLALFGPTRPEERVPAWAPVRVRSAAAGLPCAPCYDGFGYAPCALNRCLSEVTPAQVLADITALLGGDPTIPSTAAR